VSHYIFYLNLLSTKLCLHYHLNLGGAHIDGICNLWGFLILYLNLYYSVSNSVINCILGFTPSCFIASQLSNLFKFSFICMCIIMYVCVYICMYVHYVGMYVYGVHVYVYILEYL